MEELNQETQTQEQPTEGQAPVESYESPEIGDMLNNALSSEPTEIETEAEPEGEPEVTQTPEAQAQSVGETPAQAVPATPEVAPQKPAITPEIEALIAAEVQKRQQGILGALQSERAKRQAIEQQLNGAIPLDEAQSQVQVLSQRLMHQSEQAARRNHPDFDEAYSFFLNEASTNSALRDSVLDAVDPGEAAYQAGLNLKAIKELGPDAISNPYKLLEKGEQRGYEKAKAELQKEYEAKLAGLSAQKLKTPTDITKARSTGSAAIPYRTPSLAEALKMSRKI